MELYFVKINLSNVICALVTVVIGESYNYDAQVMTHNSRIIEEERLITRNTKVANGKFNLEKEYKFYFEVQINDNLGGWQAVVHG